MAQAITVFPKSTICWKIVLIFLTVGNWHKGFDRLVKAVDNFVQNRIIREEVIAQIGSGTYYPKYLTPIDYCSPIDFTDYLERSNVIISHSGIGTIGQAIELAKPVIVVPRKAELGECSDNHQWTTARQLEKEGKILVAYDVLELPDKLKEIENFKPAKIHNCQKLIEVIGEFLEELVINRCNK